MPFAESRLILKDPSELSDMASLGYLACDLETAGLDTLHPTEILGLGFANAKRSCFWPIQGDPRRLEAVRPYLESGPPKIFHNAKFDVQLLSTWGIEVNRIEDTILMSYVLEPGPTHGLDDLARRHMDYEKIPRSTLLGDRADASMKKAPLDLLARYCAEDAWTTATLWRLLKDQVPDQVYRLELGALEAIMAMERVGVLFDPDRAAAANLALQATAEEATKALGGINPRGRKDLGAALVAAGFTLPEKNGKISLSAEMLSQIDHPLVHNALKARSALKLLEYLVKLPTFRDEAGRIHCNLNQVVTTTGRLSCSNPNLQNVPTRTAEGKAIRDCFVAPKGKLLICADYSQVELRVLAAMTQETTLLAAFEAGEDIHAATAALVLGIPFDSVTSDQRAAAKTVNFGVLYGMGQKKLARTTGLPPEQAQTFIEEWFARLPKVRDWIEERKEESSKTLQATTMFGRTRPLLEYATGDRAKLTFADHCAVNTPVQGTAADIIKAAMYKTLEVEEATPLLQIHDELIFEVDEDKAQEAALKIQHQMENAVQIGVPLTVEVGIGTSWAEAK